MNVAKGFPNASETVRRLNPHIFGVGAVPAAVAKPADGKSQDDAAGKERGKMGVGRQSRRNTVRRPIARISVLACRNRLLDGDNLVASLKFLQDAVADSLLPGLPSGHADAFFKWDYEQIKTDGPEGVIVKITIP